MNEQLVVKNFGPIKDATVDFKRVTVFIGPTGGGKSTLAKLAAIFRQDAFISSHQSIKTTYLKYFAISDFINIDSTFYWTDSDGDFKMDSKLESVSTHKHNAIANRIGKSISDTESFKNKRLLDALENFRSHSVEHADSTRLEKMIASVIESIFETGSLISPTYIPSERSFVSAIEYSWAGLMRDDISLPKILLDFANGFSLAKKNIVELEIPFLQVTYLHIDGRDFIEILNREKPLMLLEAASGIQSVTPLLVLLEYLSRNTEQAQSFIIEEPELNLYPTTQQGLLNWLVEKCTKGENDLTITTHSPYLLAHFNLLLYAYQVAENHPERANDVAKIIPRESWINPKEFAAYHVEGQQENGVRSIVNPETGLISYNGLDATASAETSEFEKLLDINAGLEVE